MSPFYTKYSQLSIYYEQLFWDFGQFLSALKQNEIYAKKKNYHENCIVALNNVAFVSTVIICLLTEKQDFKVVIIGRLLAWPFGLKITEIPKFIFPPIS